jgi:uncharacterized protein (DUF302 family)
MAIFGFQGAGHEKFVGGMAASSLGFRPPSGRNNMERAMAADGLTTIRSNHGPKDTMERIEAEVKAKGMSVFARIDHSAGAIAVGLSMRPTEVIIFGNAKGGTPLMQAEQTAGIDLPLKALVWQDAAGETWISYNGPAWLAHRHGLTGAANETVIGNLSAALRAVTQAAAT